MLCQQSVTLGPVSSGSHQGSPKPLVGAPRWQPLVFMLRDSECFRVLSHPNPTSWPSPPELTFSTPGAHPAEPIPAT